MTDMINQALATDGSWTLIAEAPVKNILIASASGKWEVFVGPDAPADSDPGFPVQSINGAWGSTVLEATDAVYGRPFGAGEGLAFVVTGMKN